MHKSQAVGFAVTKGDVEHLTAVDILDNIRGHMVTGAAPGAYTEIPVGAGLAFVKDHKAVGQRIFYRGQYRVDVTRSHTVDGNVGQLHLSQTGRFNHESVDQLPQICLPGFDVVGQQLVDGNGHFGPLANWRIIDDRIADVGPATVEFDGQLSRRINRLDTQFEANLPVVSHIGELEPIIHFGVSRHVGRRKKRIARPVKRNVPDRTFTVGSCGIADHIPTAAVVKARHQRVGDFAIRRIKNEAGWTIVVQVEGFGRW